MAGARSFVITKEISSGQNRKKKDRMYNQQTRQNYGRASKGSRLHLQDYINYYPEYLNCLILSSSYSLSSYAANHPKWISPLAKKNYAEYKDKKFLDAIGYSQISNTLDEFWPSGGPVWDALAKIEGRDGSNGVILLEAKSHIGELKGQGCRAIPNTRGKIEQSLTVTKKELGVREDIDWTGEFYQYANRLAHLYFLNIKEKIPTWLVFLYFIKDIEQGGPTTVAEWINTLDETKKKLGLPKQHILDTQIISVFAPAFRKNKNSDS